MNISAVGDKAKIAETLKKIGYEIMELDADGKPNEKKTF
jgi:zinc protease